MKRFSKGKRLLAIWLSVLMAVSNLPAVTFAAEGNNQGLCEHHTEHTEDCGYAKGQPCSHMSDGGGEHSKDCYTGELICGYKEDDGGGSPEGGKDAGQIASGSDADHTHGRGYIARQQRKQMPSRHPDGQAVLRSFPAVFVTPSFWSGIHGNSDCMAFSPNNPSNPPGIKVSAREARRFPHG